MRGLVAYLRRLYARRVPVGRRAPRVTPLPRHEALDSYVGRWVAIKDGVVIMDGASSTEIANGLRHAGIRDALAQYVPPPSEAYRVGLG